MSSRFQGTPFGILPHAAFMRKAGAARLEEFHYDPRSKVASRAAFQQMQDHIDRLYRGVQVVHSFEDASGQVFDCIPFEQQPGLRSARGPLPTPPDMSRAPTMEGPGGRRDATPAAPTVDRHGNVRQAPDGTVPIRRVTLDEMTRFRDLDAFFRKYPARGLQGQGSATPTVPSTDGRLNHRYSAGNQKVANIGGASYVSIYQPAVNSHETFSLAQHWYSAGSDASLQTVEVGWQVFPGKYSTASPCLFIYYTPDSYQSGSYNLENPDTFVQWNKSFTIGGALPWLSVQGGQQACLLIGVYKWGDAWWIYLNGFQNDNILGYYPTSLYNGGGMATQADTIIYGGETMSGYPPDGEWGQMGSGTDASAGWQQAAFHCYIYYWPPGGGAQWANLAQILPSPCYGYVPGFDPNSWGSYFFFGGAGGADC